MSRVVVVEGIGSDSVGKGVFMHRLNAHLCLGFGYSRYETYTIYLYCVRLHPHQSCLLVIQNATATEYYAEHAAALKQRMHTITADCHAALAFRAGVVVCKLKQYYPISCTCTRNQHAFTFPPPFTESRMCHNCVNYYAHRWREACVYGRSRTAGEGSGRFERF